MPGATRWFEVSIKSHEVREVPKSGISSLTTTPMEFVIGVLQRFFAMDTEQATRIMLKVHNEGRGVCGVFPRDIAATKVEQVSAFARQHQHPLACVMEEN